MQSFQSIHLYPELHIIANQFDMLHAEALNSFRYMKWVNDTRVHNNSWCVLPILPEEEDRNFISDAELKHIQSLVPKTALLFSSILSIKAYAYSVLKPQSSIAPHKHTNPYVTASLCLEGNCDSFIRVNNEIQIYRKREIIIFDYTQVHEVVNNGNSERVVLLILLPNRNV